LMLCSQLLNSSEMLLLLSPFKKCDFIFCSYSDTMREYCGISSIFGLRLEFSSLSALTRVKAFLCLSMSLSSWQVSRKSGRASLLILLLLLAWLL